jgi:hypothetical protein
MARADANYAIPDRFDEASGEYVGLKLGRLVDHGQSLRRSFPLEMCA